MEYKIITPVAIEPVSLAEAKLFTRSNDDAYKDYIATTQSILPGAYTSTQTGASVEVLGYTAIATLSAGTCSGTITAKIQESDDGATWNDYDSFTVSTGNSTEELAYGGTKQYIRIYAAVTGTCSFSANVVVNSGDSTEDTLLSALITTAREYCENFTRRALATQTVEAYLPTFPACDRFELPFSPLQSVTSVKYKNSAGVETTMTEGTDYLVDDESNVGGIILPYGYTWPSFTEYPLNAVKVRYTAGYNSLNPLPKAIKQAMCLLIGYWYDNRSAVLTGSISKEMEFTVKALLNMYRAKWF
ncbi:MAG: head-tail connector protein [Clostridia bacterium]|jgi:uncharacterized phiE125 gp8 family phage protein|nr:head-tail connector protein [Clostridia bacterium]